MSRRADAVSVDDGAVNFDRILVEEVGQCGRYQVRVIALCSLVAIVQSMVKYEYMFVFSNVETRCVIPECENASSSHFNFTPPWISNAVPPSHDSFDNCHRYGNTTANTTDSCPADIFDRDSLIPCEEYVYEDKNSAVYDFGMACDPWRPNLLGSVNLLGMMVSLPLTGFVADRWGRRTAMTIAAVNHAWIGCLKYYAGSYIVYLLLSVAANIVGAAASTCAFILVIENVGPNHRATTNAALSSFHSLGNVILGFMAWAGPSWRHLILMANAPFFIIFSYFWIAPESFRWLMSKGHYEDAEKVLRKAAEINGNVLSEKTSDSIRTHTKKNKDCSEPWLVCLVFKHKQILFRSILTPVWWITTMFIHYGLTMSAVAITGNKYFNFIAVSSASILGYWIAPLLLNRIGRKPVLIAGYWICGACQIAYILILDGHYWLSLSVYLVGKLFIACVVVTTLTFTAELYPTRYRSSLLTYSSMVGRLGAIIAPLTPALSEAVWKPLPFVLFAGMALLCGLLVTLAPETLGCALPDSMEEAENLGKDQRSSILQPLRRLVFRGKCDIRFSNSKSDAHL